MLCPESSLTAISSGTLNHGAFPRQRRSLHRHHPLMKLARRCRRDGRQSHPPGEQCQSISAMDRYQVRVVVKAEVVGLLRGVPGQILMRSLDVTFEAEALGSKRSSVASASSNTIVRGASQRPRTSGSPTVERPCNGELKRDSSSHTEASINSHYRPQGRVESPPIAHSRRLSGAPSSGS